MKKIISALIAGASAAAMFGVAYAKENPGSAVYFNGGLMDFENALITEEGCTMVAVREFSEQIGFEVTWNGEKKEVEAYKEGITLKLQIDNNNILAEKDGESYYVQSVIAPKIIDSVTYVPLRALSEAFGAEVIWEETTNIIRINMPGKAETTQNGSTFYSQYDKDYIANYSAEPYNWTDGRNGYCYVTAYAMLLSDITGMTITPKDVADINIAAGGSPKTCYHGAIVGKYGRKLIPALDSGSVYYKSYDSSRGLTYIDNSSDENVIAAIKEALNRNPKGVMVRDTSMPHTMVAVGYDGDDIYFNDPALQEAEVTWSKTCLKKRSISTIVAIIAIQ